MPPHIFVSATNPFALREGVPELVVIITNKLNLNENLIEVALRSKTKAILVVRSAVVVCEMDTITAIARKCNSFTLEDEAQGMFAS